MFFKVVVRDGEKEQMGSINSFRQSRPSALGIFGCLSFKQTVIQLKSLSLLIQQLNLTLGGKEPLQSVAGELKGLKGAESVNQLKVQPIYYSLNETNTTNNVLFQSEFPVSSCKLQRALINFSCFLIFFCLTYSSCGA